MDGPKGIDLQLKAREKFVEAEAFTEEGLSFPTIVFNKVG